MRVVRKRAGGACNRVAAFLRRRPWKPSLAASRSFDCPASRCDVSEGIAKGPGSQALGPCSTPPSDRMNTTGEHPTSNAQRRTYEAKDGPECLIFFS